MRNPPGDWSEDAYLVWVLRQVLDEEVAEQTSHKAPEQAQALLRQMQAWNSAEQEHQRLLEQRSQEWFRWAEWGCRKLYAAANGLTFYGITAVVVLLVGWLAGLNTPCGLRSRVIGLLSATVAIADADGTGSAQTDLRPAQRSDRMPLAACRLPNRKRRPCVMGDVF